jgi:hypothetical protein
MSTEENPKRRGRPAILTAEEKKERIKMRNANRGPQRQIWRTCSICEISTMSQNYNRHLLSRIHIKNMYIRELHDQLDKEKNNNIPNE